MLIAYVKCWLLPAVARCLSHCWERNVLSSSSGRPPHCSRGLWHWCKAELCFLESGPGIYFGCFILVWEQTQKGKERKYHFHISEVSLIIKKKKKKWLSYHVRENSGLPVFLLFKFIQKLPGTQDIISYFDHPFQKRLGPYNNCKWLIETSFCSFYLPNVVPVETLDPVAFCFLCQRWGLYDRIIYQSL